MAHCINPSGRRRQLTNYGIGGTTHAPARPIFKPYLLAHAGCCAVLLFCAATHLHVARTPLRCNAPSHTYALRVGCAVTRA